MKRYEEMNREELLQELRKRDQAATTSKITDDAYLEIFTEMGLAWAECEILCDGDGNPCDFRYLRISPSFVERTGLGVTVGRTVLELFPKLERWWIDTYGRVALTGVSTVFENYSNLADKHLEVHAFSRERGKFTAVLRDVTERKEIEYALIQKQTELELSNDLLEQRVMERTAELEAAIRSQETFSYSVSHDLRAPLRHMNSYSAMLIEDHGDALPPEARVYLDRIRAASDKMGRLIDHLLELSRMSRAELKIESVDISELANATLTMFRETEPHRDVKQVVEEGITVVGDTALLRQLLENLLGNAWKYTSQRSRGAIRFGKVDCCGEETYYVADNGTGFDMVYRDKLFRPFERLHGSDYEGLGIGLATAQRIVQRHGGRIWCEGKPGEGASFYFTLPLPYSA